MTLRRILGFALITLALLAVMVVVMPTRTWLHQREQLAAEEARLAVLQRENHRLAARVEELQTDAEVERLAREQYNLVKPGEEAYAILPGPADAAVEAEPSVPRPATEVAVADPPSFLNRFWDHVTFWD